MLACSTVKERGRCSEKSCENLDKARYIILRMTLIVDMSGTVSCLAL